MRGESCEWIASAGRSGNAAEWSICRFVSVPFFGDRKENEGGWGDGSYAVLRPAPCVAAWVGVRGAGTAARLLPSVGGHGFHRGVLPDAQHDALIRIEHVIGGRMIASEAGEDHAIIHAEGIGSEVRPRAAGGCLGPCSCTVSDGLSRTRILGKRVIRDALISLPTSLQGFIFPVMRHREMSVLLHSRFLQAAPED